MLKFFTEIAGYAILVIILSCYPAYSYAQEIQVRGIVTSESGEAIPWASVVIKGSSIGALTDANGEFTLNAKDGDVLHVSYLGYISKDVSVSQNYMEISLKESAVDVDEVVVIGYGAVKKSDLTGSVATIKMDEVANIPSVSVERLLQGRSAGLQVVNSSQSPGAGATVRIRGGSSLRGSNAPLIVVDGFPLGDAGNLHQYNTADIASIEVLKDASASAIYGSRGANGVILITTNKAKKGETKVSVRHRTSISQFTKSIVKWTDPVLMIQINNESRINGGYAPLFTGQWISGTYYPSVKDVETGEWPYFTDWSKVAFRSAPVSNNTTLQISSANEKTSFNLSGNFMNQQGVFIKDDYMKGGINVSVSHKMNDWLTLSTMNNVSKNERDANSGLSYWRSPLMPIYNEDGSYYLNGETDFDHPLAQTEGRKNLNRGVDFITSWVASAQILPELTLRTQLNYKYGSSTSDRYDSQKYTSNGYNNNGAAYLDTWTGQNITSETYATYDKVFGDKHHLNVMAGHSYEYYIDRGTEMRSYGFVNETLGNENMGAGDPERNEHFNSYSKTKLLSFLGRINYTWDDRLLVTFTMRADASTKFGADNRWAYFPSAAISWKLHNEDFIKKLNIFDQLKPRISYGISGNQGISPYQTLSRYGTEKYYSEGKWNTAIGPGYISDIDGDWRNKVWSGIPNTGLKWETTRQLNVGVDMAFLENRLRLTVDYYTKETHDLLRERIISLSSGYNRMWVNDGKIRNTGIEITVDSDIIHTKDWMLSGTLIFSRNRNKVLSLGDSVQSGLITDHLTGMKYEYYGSMVSPFVETSPNILAIGQPVNAFYGYKVNGIVQSEEEGRAAGLLGKEAQAGEFHYLDLSKNGVFDTNDRTIIGDPNPDFTMSLNLNLQWKNFDFNLFLNGVFGNDILYAGKYNQPDFMPLRWTPDNQTNRYPSVRDGRIHYVSDYFIEDGSFMRIQNMALGYTLKLNKPWLKSMRFYVNVDNLYTFTGFKGYDPEVGLDGRYWGGYPRFRNWTFGIDVTF